jgi:hypothetical protein
MTSFLLNPRSLALLCALAVANGAGAQSPKADPAAPAAGAAPADATAVARTTAAVDAAPPVRLRLQYHTMAIGNDGVQRDTRYANTMVRRPGRVWVERDLPAAVRDVASHGHAHAHGPHAGHAHDEAQGAPLQVRRDADGTERVEVVLARTARVIEVDRAHHGNVGYGGSWDAVYWLVPPAALRKMQAVGAPRAGVQRYRAQSGEQVTQVDWDIAGQFPRRVERTDGHGAASYRMIATALPMPAAPPWKASEAYARGDYSDLLD